MAATAVDDIAGGNGPRDALALRLAGELGALPEAEIKVKLNDLSEIELTVKGATFKNVKLVRCFPVSAENKYIEVLDAEGVEIGVIEDLDKCRPEVRQLLADALNDIYLVPRILQINKVTTKGFVPIWDVETDRGHHVFELRTRREIIPIGNRVIIRDADGNRYEVPDYTQLDKHSRMIMELEM